MDYRDLYTRGGGITGIPETHLSCPAQMRVLRCNSAMYLKSVCATMVLTKCQHYGLLVTVETHAAHAIGDNRVNTITLC